MPGADRYQITPPDLDRDGLVYWAGEQFRWDCAKKGVEYRAPSMVMSGVDDRRVILRNEFHGLLLLAAYRYGVNRNSVVWFDAEE